MAKETTELYIKTENLGKFIGLLKETGYSFYDNSNPYQTFSRPLSEIAIKIPHSEYSPTNNRYSFIHISSSNPKTNGLLLQKTREELAKEARISGISITQYV